MRTRRALRDVTRLGALVCSRFDGIDLAHLRAKALRRSQVTVFGTERTSVTLDVCPDRRPSEPHLWADSERLRLLLGRVQLGPNWATAPTTTAPLQCASRRASRSRRSRALSSFTTVARRPGVRSTAGGTTIRGKSGTAPSRRATRPSGSSGPSNSRFVSHTSPTDGRLYGGRRAGDVGLGLYYQPLRLVG